MHRKIIYPLFLLVSIAFFSCKKNSNSEDDGGGKAHQKYVFSYWLSDYTQFIWSVDSLANLMKGEISMAGVGIEQSGDCIPLNNTFFAAHSGDEGAVSYGLNASGNLTSLGKVALESIYAIGQTPDNKAILIGAPWDGSSANIEINIYDPKTISITNKSLTDVSYYRADDTLYYWPTGASVSGNYLYIPSFLRKKDWNILNTDTAYLRVYSYPDLQYVTTLKDPRTGPIGMYYTNAGIIRNEAGDIYTFSSSAYAAGYKPSGKPSGIMRIKNGQSTFDQDYFLNFETSSVHGKVISAYYAGNNKVVVKYIPVSADDESATWKFLDNTAMLFKTAIVDLETKAITSVTGIADHAGDEYFGLNSLYVEDGYAYKSYLTNTEARLYRIDLSSGAATPGALLRGGLWMPVIGKLTY